LISGLTDEQCEEFCRRADGSLLHDEKFSVQALVGAVDADDELTRRLRSACENRGQPTHGTFNELADRLNALDALGQHDVYDDDDSLSDLCLDGTHQEGEDDYSDYSDFDHEHNDEYEYSF